MEESLWQKLKAVLASERFVALLVGALLVAANRLGLVLDAVQLASLVSMFVAFILGTSWRKPGTVPADHVQVVPPTAARKPARSSFS